MADCEDNVMRCVECGRTYGHHETTCSRSLSGGQVKALEQEVAELKARIAELEKEKQEAIDSWSELGKQIIEIFDEDRRNNA